MNTRMPAVSMDPVKHWIDGRQVDSAERFITTNPATGKPIAEVALGGEAEINAAVAAAKAAFPAWANTPAKQRAKLMRRLGELIEQNVPHLAALETLDDMLFAEGSEISADRFIVPRVEVELAFVLGKRLEGPEATLFDVYDAVDHVIPALEIIDARSQSIDPESGRPRRVFDTIADNAANAGVVMGGRPIRMRDVDLRWVGAILSRTAVIEETGVAAGGAQPPG